MITGTPLDLTPWGIVLQGVGLLYWALAAAALILALKRPATRRAKVIAAAAVVIAFGALPAWQVAKGIARGFEQRAAWSHFDERCKSAGERIERRESGVEGVYLMKVRPERVNYDEQFTPDDVYGHDTGGEHYIQSFLRISVGADLSNQFGEPLLPTTGRYLWVEAADPKNGRLYRYTLVNKQVKVRSDEEWARVKKNAPNAPREVRHVVLERQPIERPTARYGVTWDDISTREDREHWVAGGVLQVFDLQTNTLIAERKGYMFDRALGSRAGFRSPWRFARDTSCPHHRMTSDGRAYVDAVSSQFTQSILESSK